MKRTPKAIIKEISKIEFRELMIIGIDQNHVPVLRSTMGEYATRDLADWVAQGFIDREAAERVDDDYRRRMN